MLIGFSHLNLNAVSAFDSIRKLEKLGYQKKFSEVNLENSAVKKELLNNYSPVHDLHFMVHDLFYNIEVIDNKSSNSSTFQNRILYENSVTIRCSENDFPLEKKFWTLIGFKKECNTFSLFRPIKSLSFNFNLVVSNENLCQQKLDNIGITSLAFLVKNIDQFVLKFSQYWFSQLLNTVVNSNRLKILFVKSPSGLIIEFVEVVK